MGAGAGSRDAALEVELPFARLGAGPNRSGNPINDLLRSGVHRGEGLAFAGERGSQVSVERVPDGQ